MGWKLERLGIWALNLTEEFINAKRVNSVVLRNEAYFMSFAAIITIINGSDVHVEVEIVCTTWTCTMPQCERC